MGSATDTFGFIYVSRTKGATAGAGAGSSVGSARFGSGSKPASYSAGDAFASAYYFAPGAIYYYDALATCAYPAFTSGFDAFTQSSAIVDGASCVLQ